MKLVKKIFISFIAIAFISMAVAKTPKKSGPGNPGGHNGFGGGFGGGHASADIDYSGAVEITSNKSEKNATYSTSTVDVE